MEEHDIQCPYCGEIISCLIDPSVDEQEYYEDCSVCCNPILFNTSLNELNNIQVIVIKDND